MAAVNQFLEEERFEERVGGSFAARPDDELFIIEKTAKTVPGKRNRKEAGKLRCFSNLEGLPGVPDPKPIRNSTLTPLERENPIVKDMKLKKIQAGKIQKKYVDSKVDRAKFKKMKKDNKVEAMTRRRTNFDFDLWAESEDLNSHNLPSTDWVKTEVITHAAIGSGKLVPKFAKSRKVTSGTKVAAVEVPDAGASYNPNIQDHQNLLWKAAMVEIEKEKASKKLERQTTAMFPSRNEAPTEKTFIQEMSEGIVELNGGGDLSDSEESADECEEAGTKNSSVLKPKTRRQKRDKRKRMFEDQKKTRERNVKIKETEISRLKSIKRELKSEEAVAAENEEKRKVAKEEKMAGPLKLSNYNYEPQEIEIKLSEELTGNLRNLKQEGSLLEDRFKSMQRRNMIEVRVKQKTVKRLKRKKFEKKGHRMGWEENPNKVAKKIRQEAKVRQKRRKLQSS